MMVFRCVPCVAGRKLDAMVMKPDQDLEKLEQNFVCVRVLRKGDVIIAVDGKTAALTESQFLALIRLTHGPADGVKLTVLRGQNKEELTVPMW